MPNRIIRESARFSPTLAALSDAAERLFWRLVVSADDYGRFEAEANIVKGACVPTLNWSVNKVERCLTEFASTGNAFDLPLVSYYFIGGRRFGQMNGWPRHQRPPRLASKYPDPPDMFSIPSERNIHDRLFQHLQSVKLFCTYPILSLDRNVRAGNGFADLLIGISQGRILVELKRTRADVGAIRQVCNYRAALKEIVAVVILATGFGPTVGAGDFTKEGVALISYDEKGTTTLTVSNQLIHQCCDLVIPVNSRELQLVPDTRDEIRESGVEKREARSDPPAVWVNDFGFDEFWKIFPRKDGKQKAKEAWNKIRPDASLREIIRAAITRQNISPQWLKDDGQFIPMPATWLRGKRWDDQGAVVMGQQAKCAFVNTHCEEYAVPGSKYCQVHGETIRKAQEGRGLVSA